MHLRECSFARVPPIYWGARKCDTVRMSKPNSPRGADSHKTPPQLVVAIGTCLIAAQVVILAGFIMLPSLGAVHQSFWSGLIGSFVGSVVAFVLAALLWRIERHVLVEERIQDRRDLRREEQYRGDKRALRDCLAALGNLRALNYHMVNEGEFDTARDEYLMDLKIKEAAALIGDDELREEAHFITRLVEDDGHLDYMISPKFQRFYLANDWLVRLISLDLDASPTSARPKSYDSLIAGLEEYDKERRRQWEEIDLREEEERKRLQREKHEKEPAETGTSETVTAT